MKEKVKILFYGKAKEIMELTLMLSETSFFDAHPYESKNVEIWEEFEISLIEWNPDLVIVTSDGAAGMEGVYLVRSRRPEIPVIWFSDDYDFGMQSHRLECLYFSTKPVTAERLGKAIKRYFSMYKTD